MLSALCKHFLKPEELVVGVFIGEAFQPGNAAQGISFNQQCCNFLVKIRALVAVVESECAGSKVPAAGFAPEDPKLLIEVADFMEALFDKAWFGIAVWIWTFFRYEAHKSTRSK